MSSILREFKFLFSRKSHLALLVFVPFILYPLFATIYINGVVRDIPIAVLDYDNTQLSRTIIRSLDAAGAIKVENAVTDISEAEVLIKSGKVQAALVIPKDTERKIKSGRNATVVLYKNSTNIVIGNMILKDASAVVRMISGAINIKRIMAKGVSAKQASVLANPVKPDTQSLFNPAYSYLDFLVAPLMLCVLQMILMLSSASSINGDKNMKSGLSGPVTKFVAFLIIAAIHLAFIFTLMFVLLRVPFSGCIITVFAFSMLFSAGSISIGLAISYFVKDELFAAEIGLLFNTPAFMFSGFTFPLWGMPLLHNVFALLIPFTHFLNGFLKINRMGAPIKYILPEAGILLLFVIIPMVPIIIATNFSGKK